MGGKMNLPFCYNLFSVFTMMCDIIIFKNVVDVATGFRPHSQE